MTCHSSILPTVLLGTHFTHDWGEEMHLKSLSRTQRRPSTTRTRTQDLLIPKPSVWKSILDRHTKRRYVDNKTRRTHKYAKEYTRRTHKRAICR